jgi:peptide/nickel transport system substrate-binding protein
VILNDPKTFNAALGSESPNIFDLTYEGLLTQNPINGKIEGALAQSWEISPDKTKITFTMREGLKWSDGQPLTVDDVVFTYNDIYLNEKIPLGLLPYSQALLLSRHVRGDLEDYPPFLWK